MTPALARISGAMQPAAPSMAHLTHSTASPPQLYSYTGATCMCLNIGVQKRHDVAPGVDDLGVLQPCWRHKAGALALGIQKTEGVKSIVCRKCPCEV